MLKNKEKGLVPSGSNARSGFTIIEVLIVLAIAGLIMLIVFLAVPALQRNSRNTQRKNDVSAMLAAISEYSSNHNGQIPTTTGSLQTIAGDINLGYYETTGVTYSANTTNSTTIESMAAYKGVKCAVDAETGLATGDATSTGASTRQYVIMYTLEGSSGKMCQES
jgi:prepilin-type N-terminal cleavage/methylation domain-containing protein